jgi:GT2 family glycosyltransferase
VDAWPRTPRFELIVVDNCGSAEGDLPGWVRRIAPGRNLGFAGGANRGIASARAPAVLLLNPDARPKPGALDRLVASLAAHPDAAGVVPRLIGPAGDSQHRWQLRPLPRPWELLLHAFFVPVPRGAERPPERGAAIEQPAAAALALRRSALEEVGGFDEGFFPAWFEDVDLARRLARRGARLVYEPSAELVHEGGASLAELGYDRFLWIYYRNLTRYLRLHHGRPWACLARALVPLGMALRLGLLPLRRPRRADSRVVAAAGLAVAAAGALSGWRLPARCAAFATSPGEQP